MKDGLLRSAVLANLARPSRGVEPRCARLDPSGPSRAVTPARRMGGSHAEQRPSPNSARTGGSSPLRPRHLVADRDPGGATLRQARGVPLLSTGHPPARRRAGVLRALHTRHERRVKGCERSVKLRLRATNVCSIGACPPARAGTTLEPLERTLPGCYAGSRGGVARLRSDDATARRPRAASSSPLTRSTSALVRLE